MEGLGHGARGDLSLLRQVVQLVDSSTTSGMVAQIAPPEKISLNSLYRRHVRDMT